MTEILSLLFGAWIALALLIGLGCVRGAGTAERKIEDLEAGIDTAGQGDDLEPK